MSRAKEASQAKRARKALPVLGAAGLSLSLASGASIASPAPSLDSMTRSAAENRNSSSMKRKSSNRAWRHSTSSTKKRRDPRGPGSGPSPLAVPVASSRAWEGKAVPVLRARLRLAAMPIRLRLVPTGQRTSTCGKSHRKRACRHVKSGRGLCPRATGVASLAGRAKTKKNQALDCQLHSKHKKPQSNLRPYSAAANQAVGA